MKKSRDATCNYNQIPEKPSQGIMKTTFAATKKARLNLDEYRGMGIKISVENNLIVKALKRSNL